MYEFTIITKYDVIKIQVDDYNSPEIKKALEQPYILSVEMHQLKGKCKIRSKKDEKQQNGNEKQR